MSEEILNVTPEADAHLSDIITREKAEGILLSVKGEVVQGLAMIGQL